MSDINKPSQSWENVENKRLQPNADLLSAIESKEKFTSPNVIICRRHLEDKQNDMNAIKNSLPQIEKNVVYLFDPNQIKSNIKTDQKNIIFLGQYFNYNKTGTETAREIKEMWLDTEIILVTSIDVYYWERSACDYVFKIDTKMNKSDWANIIVDYLKNKINN